jgi:DNA (cytosine-5)-methyltransferase 1
MVDVLEICAGAGGQSLGLEQAGFCHAAAIEIDQDACATLRLNRPSWEVRQEDAREIKGSDFAGVALFAGGVPCPPFSIAGKQLGSDDDRDLFPTALRIIGEAKPTAVLLENVKGLAGVRFAVYRRELLNSLLRMGYDPTWRVLNASDYGVPQLRPRFILVAIQQPYAERFEWPTQRCSPPTVGATVGDLMASRGWSGAQTWAEAANKIAPTIVGGSKKHGGPDLGPSRARSDWSLLKVNGRGIADEPPSADFPLDGVPKLTTRMVARLQGFPDEWVFVGKKTAAYRQVGNAFPPPVAREVAKKILEALRGDREVPHKRGAPVPQLTAVRVR